MIKNKLTPQQRLSVAYHKLDCKDPNCGFDKMNWDAPHKKDYLDKSIKLLHMYNYKDAMNYIKLKSNHFADENGDFKSSQDIPEGQTSIGKLMEIQEWLYFRTDIDNETKLNHIKNIEEMELDQLHNIFGKDNVNHPPIWSVRLENDMKEKV